MRRGAFASSRLDSLEVFLLFLGTIGLWLHNKIMELVFGDAEKDFFISKLRSGINLFAGAGFSTLPSPSGMVLPTGKKLIQILSDHFGLLNDPPVDLGMYCQILFTRFGDTAVKNYIRSLFLVSDINPLYSSLLNVGLASFVTTNIDNIFLKVISQSKTYYVRDIALSGGSIPDSKVIPYLPLHGDVTKDLSSLKFTRSEIAGSDKTNDLYFDYLKILAKLHPTLFVGYSMADPDVFSALISTVNDPANLWILCLPDDKTTIYAAQQLHCHVIQGDTEALLVLFQSLSSAGAAPMITRQKELEKYRVPQLNSLPKVPIYSFFRSAATNLYSVLSDYAVKTEFFYQGTTFILNKQKAIFLGVGSSGKSVLAMQLAKEYQDRAVYCPNLATVEESRHIATNLSPDDIVFVDDCINNAVAFDYLLEHASGSVIGFAENYAFEGGKHLLLHCPPNSNIVDISDLSDSDINLFWQKIPETIRKPNHIRKQQSGQVTFYELLPAFVSDFLSQKMIERLLETINKDGAKDVFDLLCLAVYLTSNKSLLSMDSILSYFSGGDYEQIAKNLRKLTSYLVEAGQDGLAELPQDQNYYLIRSTYFSYQCSSVLQRAYPAEYGRVVKRFLINTNPYCICFLDTFSRKAFDSRFFLKLFGKEADDLYSLIFQKFSPLNGKYILQQWALYCCECQEYDKAFQYIDQARTMDKMNLSIENTFAVIQFKSNLGKPGEEAKSLLKNSLEILINCYRTDKRKDMHAKSLGYFAVDFFKQYNDPSYLSIAYLNLVGAVNSDPNKHKFLDGVIALLVKTAKRANIVLS